MENFFFFTAWPMVPPAPYSFFHITFTIIGTAAAFLAARFLSSRTDKFRPLSVLFFSGLLLAVSEAYKQGFLYTVVNSHSFDWWYFPFQLCSVPMYLCLLYPFFAAGRYKKILDIFATFIQDFGILGGIMALVEPSGLMHPYWTLTIHGFLWHFFLIFLGLYCCFCHISDNSPIGFKQVIPLFFICCIIASLINITSGPNRNADMFYISPYYPSLQVVFHTISLHIGILPGNLIYLACVCIGAWIIHKGCSSRKNYRGLSKNVSKAQKYL